MKKKLALCCLVSIMLAFSSCVLTENLSSSSSSSDSSEIVDTHTEHVDADNNGVCDECKESTIRTFDIYALNDLHGKMLDTDSQIGVDEMTTYLRQAKANNPNTILLSSGDMWQGSPESNLTKGKMMTDWMNDLGFVSMTLGNHEYDWGEDYIEANSQLANFPFLAINIYDRETEQRVDYCESSVMLEMDGAKIGVIGAMGDCYSSIASDNTKGIYFLTGDLLTELVKAEAEKLRAEGADCIIYSIHDSYNDNGYDLALSQGYVDIVFEGHTHAAYAEKDMYGVYHLQDGGDNKYGISKATMEINIANEKAKATQGKVVYASEYKNLEDDPIIETLANKYQAEVEKGYRTLGYNETRRNSSALSSLVAQLYLEAGREKWGTEYDIVLGGGSINVRSPYELPVGDVTYGNLLMLFPFDNQLVLCSIKGRNLLDRFVNNSRYYVAYEIDPAAIEYNKTYYIVTDTWNSPYAKNQLTEVERWEEEVYARDLLADYIAEGNMGKKPAPIQPSEIRLTSIPQILEIGGALGDNKQTTEVYDVEGTVLSVENYTWGNMTIQDGDGNILYIFGVYDMADNRYDAMDNPPTIGDKIILRGVIKKYIKSGSPLIEMVNGKVIQMNGENANV